jgi:hypothetical protein
MHSRAGLGGTDALAPDLGASLAESRGPLVRQGKACPLLVGDNIVELHRPVMAWCRPWYPGMLLLLLRVLLVEERLAAPLSHPP